MRSVTPSEILSLREMLQMESNALSKIKATRNMITDEQLKAQADATIIAAEGRIRGIQQFVSENEIVSMKEVH